MGFRGAKALKMGFRGAKALKMGFRGAKALKMGFRGAKEPVIRLRRETWGQHEHDKQTNKTEESQTIIGRTVSEGSRVCIPTTRVSGRFAAAVCSTKTSTS
jgi:hypothetical protein